MQEDVTKFVSGSSNCPEMKDRVCELIEKTRECCPPCQAAISQLVLCSDGEHFLSKEKNCSDAQICLAEGIASDAMARGGFLAVAVVAVTFLMLG